MKRKKNISESKIGEWCLKKKYTQKLEGYWHRPIYRSKFVVRRGRGEGGTGTFPTLKRIRPFSVSYISRVLNKVSLCHNLGSRLISIHSSLQAPACGITYPILPTLGAFNAGIQKAEQIRTWFLIVNTDN